MRRLKSVILRLLGRSRTRTKTRVKSRIGKKRFVMELDEDLYNELKRISKEYRISMGATIRILLTDYLKRERTTRR